MSRAACSRRHPRPKVNLFTASEMSERVFAGSIAYRHTAQRVVEAIQTEPRVSSPPAERAQLDIRAAKRRVKEGELGALLRDWEDTVKQSGSALGPAERNRLDRQAADIWGRIEALERKLADVGPKEPRTE